MILEFSLALHRLPTGKLLEAADLRTFARLQLAHLRKRARRRHEAAATLVPARIHALRIALKRLRYGIEFLGTLFPARAVERYRKQLAKAQTTLGFLHDLDVARGALEGWAGSRSDLLTAAAFVIGWHSPRYARSRRRALAEAAPLLWGKTPW
jgi:adenylate cyclase